MTAFEILRSCAIFTPYPLIRLTCAAEPRADQTANDRDRSNAAAAVGYQLYSFFIFVLQLVCCGRVSERQDGVDRYT